MLEEAAGKRGAAPYALRKTDAGWSAVSFSGAREGARELAAWFLSQGFRPGDACAVLGEGSPEWVVGELGLTDGRMRLCSSLHQAPRRGDTLPPQSLCGEGNPDDEEPAPEGAGRSRGGRKTRSLKIIYLDDDPEWARGVAAEHSIAADRVIGFAEARTAGRARLPELAGELQRIADAAGEDDTVTICYTSGTTGNPKGIMLTHLNYWTNCHDGVKAIPFGPGWRSLIILPMDHSFAHTAGLYTSLLCGFAMYFVDSRGGAIGTLRNIPVNLLECNPHFLFTVPTLSGNLMKKIVAGVEAKGGLIEKLFKAGIAAGIAFNGNGWNRPGLGKRARSFFPYVTARLLIFGKVKRAVFGKSIRFCVGGGALLDVKQQEFFAALGVPIYQGYGLTEAAPIISANTPRKHKFGTSGPVLESVECRFVKPDGSPAAAQETGELVIRGGNVMKGYFRNPEASAAALRDGWLYTGDLARWDPDGFLVVVGREKALLIAEDGEKYSPEEIEEAVTSCTDVVDQVMAFCDHRKYTAALVTLDTGKVERLVTSRGITCAAALLAELAAELNRYRTDPRAKKVQAAWAPAVFQIVAEPFSDKDGTMNSTMKMVRHRVAEVHGGLMEYSYTAEGSTTDNPRNLAAVAALFKLS